MQPREGQAADWKDAAAYAPLLDADRAFLAWEWLRRRGDYKAAATRHLSEPGRSASERDIAAELLHWGLHRYEPPHLPPAEARPVWRRDVHPGTLEVEALECGAGADCFDLGRLRRFATIVDSEERTEHLLLSDGLRFIRIDVQKGSVRHGPVRLRYRISGLEAAEVPLLSLRRLLALCRRGRFSAALHPPFARAGRLILMLRAHDAISTGASQREIAAVLLSNEVLQDRWRSEAPSLRSTVQRLVKGAEAMMEGGYLGMLRR